MIKKLVFKFLFKKKDLSLDARFWIQKILLQKHYSK